MTCYRFDFKASMGFAETTPDALAGRIRKIQASRGALPACTITDLETGRQFTPAEILTEATPAGLQTIIPGCEKRTPPTQAQLIFSF